MHGHHRCFFSVSLIKKVESENGQKSSGNRMNNFSIWENPEFEFLVSPKNKNHEKQEKEKDPIRGSNMQYLIGGEKEKPQLFLEEILPHFKRKFNEVSFCTFLFK